MTSTPEQLQAWREEFEKTPTKGEFGFELLGTFYAREGEYRNRVLADEFKGYLRRCQETEQIMKLAKFGAMVTASHMSGDLLDGDDFTDGMLTVELLIDTDGNTNFVDGIESTIMEILK